MKIDYICVFYYFLMLSFFKTFNLMSTDFALIALSLNSAGSVFRLTFMWHLFDSGSVADIFSLTHVALSLSKK